MTTAPSFRPALSTFVAAAFAVLAATGVLLFFDIDAGAIEALHQLFGWAFVIAGIVHLVQNRRLLAAYLRQGAARWSLASAFLVAAGLLAWGWTHPEQRRPADPAPAAAEHARAGRPPPADPAPAANGGPAGAPALLVLPASLPVPAPLSWPT